MTTLEDYLGVLVQAHAWAGRQLLASAERVPSEALHTGELSSGTLFETLRHVADVSWSWRRAAEGIAGTGLVWESVPMDDLMSLGAFWDAESQRLAEFVGRLGPEDLDRAVTPEWKDRPFRVWEIVTHIVHHQADHANEIGWQLTRLGQSPGETGFMRYVTLER